VLSGEAANISFLVFDWTRSEFETTIYHTHYWHANYYTTDVVFCYETERKQRLSCWRVMDALKSDS